MFPRFRAYFRGRYNNRLYTITERLYLHFPKSDEKLEQFIVELLQTGELKIRKVCSIEVKPTSNTLGHLTTMNFYAMEGHQYHQLQITFGIYV